jgi:hypothetical protein
MFLIYFITLDEDLTARTGTPTGAWGIFITPGAKALTSRTGKSTGAWGIFITPGAKALNSRTDTPPGGVGIFRRPGSKPTTTVNPSIAEPTIGSRIRTHLLFWRIETLLGLLGLSTRVSELLITL